ncbi:hypothetical protein F4780DRAFT_674358 [Xylariomycetidae sp. FL0641]|nr:hypothetical protein F4780DRAFT_674358 [Xylariomycetidae sp. FL0641]
MSSAFAQLKPFSLGSRSVFVRCTPAPKTFFERRAVLETLQRVSQQSIETFKKLEDNASFIAVTTKPEIIADLVNASPMTRTVVAHEHSPTTPAGRSNWGAEFDLRGTIVTPVNPVEDSKSERATPAADALGLRHKTFTLHVFRSPEYNHREAVRRNPIHGRWPSNGNGSTETFMSAALQRVVPSGALAPALRDWETGNQLSRDKASFADEGREGAAHSLLGMKRHSPREAFLLERIRQRKADAETPEVMKSLSAFADKCRKREKTEASRSPGSQTASAAQSAGLDASNTNSAPRSDGLLDNAAFKSLLSGSANGPQSRNPGDIR